MFKLLAKHSLNTFAITAEQLDSNCAVPQSSLSDNNCTLPPSSSTTEPAKKLDRSTSCNQHPLQRCEILLQSAARQAA